MRLPIVVSAVALTLTLSMPTPSGGQAAPKVPSPFSPTPTTK